MYYEIREDIRAFLAMMDNAEWEHMYAPRCEMGAYDDSEPHGYRRSMEIQRYLSAAVDNMAPQNLT